MAQFLSPLPCNELSALTQRTPYHCASMSYSADESSPTTAQHGQFQFQHQNTPPPPFMTQTNVDPSANQHHSLYNHSAYSVHNSMEFSPPTYISTNYARSHMPTLMGHSGSPYGQSSSSAVLSPDLNRSVNTSIDSGLDSPRFIKQLLVHELGPLNQVSAPLNHVSASLDHATPPLAHVTPPLDQVVSGPVQPRLCDSANSSLDSVRSVTPVLSPVAPSVNPCGQLVVNVQQPKVTKIRRGVKKHKKSTVKANGVKTSPLMSAIQSGDFFECHTKPSLSYIELISKAILSGDNERMILGDIYDYMRFNWPFYNNDKRAWRNSVRHNLSLNECFVKAEKALCGKGNYWGIHEACIIAFRNGDFRRRHARRRAAGTSRNPQSLAAPESQHYVPMTSTPVNSVVGMNNLQRDGNDISAGPVSMPNSVYTSPPHYAQAIAPNSDHHFVPPNYHSNPQVLPNGFPLQAHTSNTFYPNEWMPLNN